MNSLEDIWRSVLDGLSRSLTQTAINTWFTDCRPVELGERRLVLQTSTSFKRDILVSRFEGAIRHELSELFACDFELIILAEDELGDYRAHHAPDDILPEALDYTFDRFIVGPSNKYAHAAAIAVSENPGKVYNPLFIYGNSGLGKTHLLLAIGQAIREKNPSVKLGYVKGDDFTNQLVRSLREHTEEEFRQRYRYVDLFLVDDIQFISGKQGFQLEFFHTFETLYQSGRQIVITSDRPPKDMASLEDRLRTRFEGGLMADIQPPDLETRMAIVRSKGQGLGLLLSDEVVSYIAENITANIRQIEGVVKSLNAYRDILDDSITIESVKRAIKNVMSAGVYIPTPDAIIAETCRYFGVEETDIRGQNRSKSISMARQIAMYLIRTLTNLPLVEIGECFGRNYSTVISSTRKVEELLGKDEYTAAVIRDISSNISSLNN